MNNESFNFEVDPHQFNLRLHHFSQFQRKGKKKFKSWQICDWLTKWLIGLGFMDLRWPRVYWRSNVGLVCTCFEISVWNLACTSSGWYHTSSSSFIPICSLWSTLQPKIGQSHLSAYMALKIIYRPQIWYTHSNKECLDPYWFLSCLGNFCPFGGQKHLKEGVTELPASDTWGLIFIRISSLPLKSFPYQLESWLYTE